MSGTIVGWKLHAADRAALLARFPPAYERVIADHVTLRFGTDERTPLPVERDGEVIGIADDHRGVQALVVRIGGMTERGDGSHYHITWSLAWGRTAKESNDVIGNSGWTMLDKPQSSRLILASWSR